MIDRRMKDTMPDGWFSVKLGEVCDKVTSGSRDWAQYYSDSGSKFIRMTNLSRGSIHLNLSDIRWVSVSSNSSDGKRTSLICGDILMSITAELGKIGWIPDGFGEAYINQHTALIRTKPKSVESKYIAYLLVSKKMNNRINRMNDSGAKAGLNLPTIRSIYLQLPPLSEQKKIAQILSTWDKAIATTEKLLANSQQRKKALMQQLLSGKKRLLDKDGVRFSGEWEQVHLGQIATIQSGGTPDRKIAEFWGNDIAWVTTSEILGSEIDKTTESISKLGLENSSAKVFPEGTLLIAMYGQGKTRGKVAKLGIPAATNQACAAIILSDGYNPDFYFFYLSLQYRNIRSLSNSGGQKNLSGAIVKTISVPNLSQEEQTKIAKVLSVIDKEVNIVKLDLERLETEKKALMQQLLTGKRRVKTDEIPA